MPFAFISQKGIVVFDRISTAVRRLNHQPAIDFKGLTCDETGMIAS